MWKLIQGLAAAALILLLSIYSPASVRAENNSGCQQETVGFDSRIAGDKQDMAIKSIYLKRRNWENNGTDIFISQDGRFEVYAYALGETKKIREGPLERQAFISLAFDVCKADFFALPDEYKTPFKSQFSWWGYELTIETGKGSKTVRYHSEDNQVPDVLNNIIKQVIELAK